MKIDETLYSAFLEELNALETFRLGYAALHPGVSLDREDPDVRRLIEAMALFSARTRLAGERNINANRRRIFQQFFPFLLAPMPSMAILQALPTRQLAEPLTLEQGAEIAISPESGGAGIFRTLHEMRILPIAPAGFNTLLLPDQGYRLCLRFRASFARSEEVGRLSLFINHLNNYESSQQVLFNLRKHLRGVSVVFDQKVNELTSGAPCEVSFGMPEEDEGFASVHPLQKERLFFHFPWQELYLNLQVPQPAGSSWTEFTVLFDLDRDWPRNLLLNQDVFQPFTVPVVNRLQSMAQPIICDGTRERHPLRHPDLESGFELHSINGVYEVSKEGMIPVKHGIFSETAPSYETEVDSAVEGKKSHYLHLNYPGAFLEPKTIATDALWIQPWFSGVLAQKLAVAPYSRSMLSVKWDLPVLPVPHAENPFLQNLDGLLHFLTLSNRATLGREDLLDIFLALGISAQPQFEALARMVEDVRVEKVPIRATGSSGMLMHRYILKFQNDDPSQEPLMAAFLAHVENILNAWVSGAQIEVRKDGVAGDPGALSSNGKDLS